MANTLRGRPAPGLIVRDPAHDMQAVPSHDADYPATDYWRRRFLVGDMIAAAPTVAQPEPDRPADAAAEATGEGETPPVRPKRNS